MNALSSINNKESNKIVNDIWFSLLQTQSFISMFHLYLFYLNVNIHNIKLVCNIKFSAVRKYFNMLPSSRQCILSIQKQHIIYLLYVRCMWCRIYLHCRYMLWSVQHLVEKLMNLKRSLKQSQVSLRSVSCFYVTKYSL